MPLRLLQESSAARAMPMTRALDRHALRGSIVDVDHDLAACGSILDCGMRVGDVRQAKSARIKMGAQLSGFDQARCLPKDVAVMGTTFAGQERQQREDAGICRRTERQRRQCMRSPSERTHDVAKASHRIERCVERGSSDGVVNHVKTAPACMASDIVVDTNRVVVDRRRAELRDQGRVPCRTGCEHIGPDRARQLNGDMPDAACAAMNLGSP